MWGGYSHRWSWTGITGQTATLWDWLNLVMEPIAFALLPLWYGPKKRITRRHKQIGIGALIVFVGLVAAGYLIPWAWAGFAGNTLWDWLDLFLLPLAVALTPMFPELRARWTLRDTLLALCGLGIFTAIVLFGYLDQWDWTGLRGKHLWDWLNILILPLIVPALVIPVLQPRPNRASASTEHATAVTEATSPQPMRDARWRTNREPLAITLARSKRPSMLRAHTPGSTVPKREPALNAWHRARRPALVTGLLANAIVVVGLAIALSAGTTARRGGIISRVTSAVPPASLARDVRRLNAIVQLFIAGKRLSHAEHQYTAAGQNRVLVLQRLMSFHPPPPLQPATETLVEMSSSALSFNLLMAHRETALARTPDNMHNELRPRFIAQFNPYTRRYLRLTYTINDL